MYIYHPIYLAVVFLLHNLFIWCFALHEVPYRLYCDVKVEGQRKLVQTAGQSSVLKTANQRQATSSFLTAGQTDSYLRGFRHLEFDAFDIWLFVNPFANV